VDLQAADVEEALPWADASFDAVTLSGVLHHFSRPDDALREIRRVLRPEGRIVVIDPRFFTPVRQILNLCLQIAPHQGDYRFYSMGEATRLLERAGFRHVRRQRVGLWAYLVVAKNA
jgi:ubiquinone/menaquinone biosynthesis C-methylase UbiE